MTGVQYIRVVEQLNRKLANCNKFGDKALQEAYRAGVTVVYRAAQQVHDAGRKGNGQLKDWTKEEYNEIQRLATEVFEDRQHPLYRFKNSDAVLALRTGILEGKNIVQSEYESAKAKQTGKQGIQTTGNTGPVSQFVWKKVYGGAQAQIQLGNGLYICLYLNVPASDAPFMQLLQSANARQDRLLFAKNMTECKGMSEEEVKAAAMRAVKAYTDKQVDIWFHLAEAMQKYEAEGGDAGNG